MDEDFGAGTVILSHLILENSVKVSKELYMGIGEGVGVGVEVGVEESDSGQAKRRKTRGNSVYDIRCTESYLRSRESIQWKCKDEKDELIEKSKESK